MIRKIILITLAIAVFALAAVFASVNPDVVPVDLLFGKIEASLTVVIVVSLAIGWVLGLLSMSMVVIRLMNQRRRLKRAMRLADKEILNLRAIPDPEAQLEESVTNDVDQDPK